MEGSCVFWEGRFDGLGNMWLLDVMMLNSVYVSVRALKDIASFHTTLLQGRKR